MKLSELKELLPGLTSLKFSLKNGADIPAHFHITEVGKISREFIDCGGTIRNEYTVNLQLWNADDTDHRLEAGKLLNIIKLSEEKLGIIDGVIEIEYQGATIGKYGLDFNDGAFLLVPTYTACLAEDVCGIPESKPKVKMSELQKESSCCAPNSSCC
ncbi:DUF6428 family protein [Flavobacterium psychrotrophum]|uniref:DUF6428 family protein n=1 Tax=Flavobacterium psychrotrophum TaxID=2294119 RepID=UPI000E31E250|nr:DUF6428 family protein [Flavobacterium psychrotrophum]